MPDREATSITSGRDRVDPVTHILAGVCIARAALNRMTGRVTLTVILAAAAPDLEVLARLKGPVPDLFMTAVSPTLSSASPWSRWL